MIRGIWTCQTIESEESESESDCNVVPMKSSKKEMKKNQFQSEMNTVNKYQNKNNITTNSSNNNTNKKRVGRFVPSSINLMSSDSESDSDSDLNKKKHNRTFNNRTTTTTTTTITAPSSLIGQKTIHPLFKPSKKLIDSDSSSSSDEDIQTNNNNNNNNNKSRVELVIKNKPSPLTNKILQSNRTTFKPSSNSLKRDSSSDDSDHVKRPSSSFSSLSQSNGLVTKKKSTAPVSTVPQTSRKPTFKPSILSSDSSESEESEDESESDNEESDSEESDSEEEEESGNEREESNESSSESSVTSNPPKRIPPAAVVYPSYPPHPRQHQSPMTKTFSKPSAVPIFTYDHTKPKSELFFEGCLNGDFEFIQSLVKDEPNFDYNVKDDQGVTPLHAACIRGHLKVVQWLVEDMNRNVQISCRDFEGMTPLHFACENGHTAIVIYLIRMGGDISLKNKAGLSPLHYIAIHGNPQLTIVIPSYLIDITTVNSNMTMLHCAAHNGHDAIVRYLLDHGASKNPRDSDGYTPVHCACLMGHVKCLEVLLSSGCHINLRDHLGYSPLMLACREGQVEVAIYLINKIRDFNIRADNGDTILHCVAMSGSIHLARMLMRIIPSLLNKLNENDQSPLDLCEISEENDEDNDHNESEDKLSSYLIEIGARHGESLLELSEYHDRKERNRLIEVRMDQEKRERDEQEAKNSERHF